MVSRRRQTEPPDWLELCLLYKAGQNFWALPRRLSLAVSTKSNGMRRQEARHWAVGGHSLKYEVGFDVMLSLGLVYLKVGVLSCNSCFTVLT